METVRSLLPSSCVIPGELFSLSVPQFPHLQNENKNSARLAELL